MALSVMSWEIVKAIVIAQGLKSVEKSERIPSKRLGCRQGFARAKELQTFEDFLGELAERHKTEIQILRDRPEEDPNRRHSDRYWRHHCGTAQIEFVLERMKAYHGVRPVSASALVQVHQIMARAGPQLMEEE